MTPTLSEGRTDLPKSLGAIDLHHQQAHRVPDSLRAEKIREAALTISRKGVGRSLISPGAARLVAMLDRIGAGDRELLKHLYMATSAKLFGVILQIVNERSDAEDVLQEVYIIIWRKAAGFDSTRASPITWMVTIARNRAIDRVRSRASRPTTTLDEAADIRDTMPAADNLIDAANDAKRVNGALATLDPKHASIIRRAYFEGCTYEALSAFEDVPVATLKSWVRRGLLRMRILLEA